MPVPSENRRSLRVQRRRLERRLEALLEEDIIENDRGEALNAAMRRENELMKLLIAALERCPPVESK